MEAGANERLISGRWSLEISSLIDPSSQEGDLVHHPLSHGAGARMLFQQAWERVNPMLTTAITLADMEDMPARKR